MSPLRILAVGGWFVAACYAALAASIHYAWHDNGFMAGAMAVGALCAVANMIGSMVARR